MITRFKVLLVCIICTGLGVVGVRAAEPSAKSFVEGIYAAYKGKDARGVSLDSNAAVRRYFEPKLAALIIKDRKDARGEVGKLGADPGLDAQDREIDAVDIAIRGFCGVFTGRSQNYRYRSPAGPETQSKRMDCRSSPAMTQDRSVGTTTRVIRP